MRELGDFLRRAREEKGLDLEEVQRRTKIRRYYLEALEEGNFQAVPGEVYLRGFLQSYAEAVGLSPREVLARYHRLRASEEENAALLPPREPEKRVSFRRWPSVIVAIGSLVLLFALVFLSFDRRRGAMPPARPATVPAKDLVSLGGEEREIPTEVLRLGLTYTDRCWVVITCDGREVFTGTVEPGTRQEWTAQEVISAKFGNAGAVKAELNGRALPPLGGPGRVVVREFRRAGDF